MAAAKMRAKQASIRTVFFIMYFVYANLTPMHKQIYFPSKVLLRFATYLIMTRALSSCLPIS